MNIYVASSLNNLRGVQFLGECLRERGHTISYDWTVHGPVFKEVSSEIENHGAMRQVALAELRGVKEADAVVVLLFGGRGTHVELGAALALDKPVLIVGTEAAHYPGWPCAFYRHPRVRLFPEALAMSVVDELENLVLGHL